MVKLRFDHLVTETSQRLHGLSALIDLVDESHPKAWQCAKEALSEMAKNEEWDYGDYSSEAQFLDANFEYWLPKEEAYSILVLLSSIVETQIPGFAQRMARQEGHAFDPKVFGSDVLRRVANYIKKIGGPDLTRNVRWQVLTDLQALRNIIVHRAGKPDERDKEKLTEIRKRRPGVSLNENPFSMWHDSELSFTISYCRYFAKEVEQFFKGLFMDAGLPLRGVL